MFKLPLKCIEKSFTHQVREASEPMTTSFIYYNVHSTWEVNVWHVYSVMLLSNIKDLKNGNEHLHDIIPGNTGKYYVQHDRFSSPDMHC